MGKKGKWFAGVKNAFSPESKEKKDKKSKKKWFGIGKLTEDASESDPSETVKTLPPPPPHQQQPEVVKLTVSENNVSNQLPSEAVATAVSTTAAVTDDQPVTEVRIVTNTRFDGKSKEAAAAIRIQTAFRGYLARRALRALRGLVRLKSLMEGPMVKRQAANTLRCLQTLSRVQSQICSRRVRMSEENQALQRQLLQKHAKELATQMGEEWDDSIQSKQQIEANLLSKYEATIRRERAMAYSFTHQKTWKNSSMSSNSTFMNPRNPTWGWSWFERWMAARPWESHSMIEKEPKNNQSSEKEAIRSTVDGEISKSYARYQLNSDKLSPTTNPKISKTTKHHLSPSTPTNSASSAVVRKSKPSSPRGSVSGIDDDSRSMVSMQSYRRHSIAGPPVIDDESLPSSPQAPRYMVPTESVKAKSRLQSPLGADKNGALEKAAPASAKKQLSYPPSPARPRRHSGPPKLDTSINTEVSVTNGSS